MLQLFVKLFVILLVSQQIVSFDTSEINFNDIKIIYDLINKKYEEGMKFMESPNNKLPNQSQSVAHQILSDLNEISKNIINITKNEKMGMLMFNSCGKNNIDNDFEEIKKEISDYMTNIDYWFNESININKNQLNNEKELRRFCTSVLFGYHSVQHTLYNIYNLFISDDYVMLRPDSLTAAINHINENYENLCDKFISPQLWIYSLYIDVIIIQFKGLVINMQAYLIQSIIDDEQYVQEYIDIDTNYNERMLMYNQLFIKNMASFPRDVQRCAIKHPIQNVAFKMSNRQTRIKIQFHNQEKNTNDDSDVDCRDCNGMRHFILSSMYDNQYICESIADEIAPCYTQQLRRLSDGSAIPQEQNIKLQYNIQENALNYIGCGNCLCTFENSNILSGVSKISLTPYFSDFENNMVVVGVKFIVDNGAIRWQVKQAKVSKNGFVTGNSEWKSSIDDSKKKLMQDFDMISAFNTKRQYLYLDDVGVDSQHVVTGVAFEKVSHSDGSITYRLAIHSTKYDYTTGELLPYHQWNRPGQFPFNKSDYNRTRMEIDLSDTDNPLNRKNNHSPRESNKKIQLGLTPKTKNTAKHIVPYFDAKFVEVTPNFVLSGIGLFYKNHEKSDGYIAPRLFTYNITQILEYHASDWLKEKKDP